MNQVKQALLDLYHIDTELVALKRRMDAGPREIRLREQELEAAREQRRQAEAAIKEKVTQMDGCDLDIKAAEEEARDQEGKLHIIKSNKEYKIVTDRVKELKQKVNELESRVLATMEEMETLRQEFTAKQEAVAAAEEELQRVTREMEADRRECMAQVEELKGRRARQIKLLEELDPEMRQLYSQALRRNNGDAMAQMRDGICGKCFRRQSPNVESIVRIGRQLKKCVCGGCGRLLYTAAAPETAEESA